MKCPFKIAQDDFLEHEDWDFITPCVTEMESFEPYFYNSKAQKRLEVRCNACERAKNEGYYYCDLRKLECVGEDKCPIMKR